MRTGQVIAGRYRLDEQVGSGGMGVVWRALDEEQGRVVALKRSAWGAGADDERTRRQLRREAQIAAELHHPHIVEFFGEVTEGREHWIVMEYVPSKSLAQLLDRHRTLSPRYATHIGAQIASALQAVHAQNILHRDVKPGNILLTRDHTAKLTDFGISRSLSGDITVTDSGVITGTPAYLAPEVADGEKPTHAADVFALGATLFAAVEGTSPWGATDNHWAVVARATTGDLLPSRRAGPLAPVLSELLQLDPANRPDAARAGQLLQELADRRPVRWLDRRRRLRRRAVVTATASVAALATAAGLWVVSSGEPVAGGAAPALGDPHTADPCGLADAGVLNRFGEARLDSAYGGFNRCDVLVRLPSGAEADVMVELDQDASSAGNAARELRIIRQPETDGSCDHIVPLSGSSRVIVAAKLSHGPPPVDLCGMAGAASAHVVAVLSKDGVPQRRAPIDGTSLAGRDACSMLDTGSLDRVLGGGLSAHETGFGGWDCRWHSNTSDLFVHLTFDRNTPLGAEDGRVVDLSGHKTYIKVDGSDCSARVIHRYDVNSQANSIQELVKIVVSGPPSPDQLCRAAQELAADAAARLPPSR